MEEIIKNQFTNAQSFIFKIAFRSKEKCYTVHKQHNDKEIKEV